MTEKDYSGTATKKISKNAKAVGTTSIKQEKTIPTNKKETREELAIINLSEQQIQDYRKAGQISKQVREYAKSIIKPNMLLAEIADKIEKKIEELGAKPAFPVNLSIDDIAAHYTPTLNDDKTAQGLLKVDIGIHIGGCISDNAISIDLTPEKKYEKLIQASEEALKVALELVKQEKSQSKLNEIGKKIQTAIESHEFSPIRNLSGHGLGDYEIHSGITIPNYDNNNKKQLESGAFAIEPFATTGAGIVYDGPGSNIYHLLRSGAIRDNLARQILDFVLKEKQTLPFSQREIEKKFGKRALFSLTMLKKSGIIEEYPQLIEQNHQPVSQAELSFIIFNNKIEILGE